MSSMSLIFLLCRLAGSLHSTDVDCRVHFVEVSLYWHLDWYMWVGPMTFGRYHQRGVLRVEERTSTDFESLLKYVAGVNVVLVLHSSWEANSRIHSFRKFWPKSIQYLISCTFISWKPCTCFSDVTHSRSFGDIILENSTYYFAKPRDIDMHTFSQENLPDHEVT